MISNMGAEHYNYYHIQVLYGCVLQPFINVILFFVLHFFSYHLDKYVTGAKKV